MTITVGEDSYASVAEADTYWAQRNSDTWSNATAAQKEAGLREATQYLDGTYDWIGFLRSDTQPLAWPRTFARITHGPFRGKYITDDFPKALKDATCELAHEALAGRLEEAAERGGMVARETVDVITVEYSTNAPAHRQFSFVDKILRGLYQRKTRLVRA